MSSALLDDHGQPVKMPTPKGVVVQVPLVWTPEWVGHFIDAQHVLEKYTGEWLAGVLMRLHEIEHLRIGLRPPPRWRFRLRAARKRLHLEACERDAQRREVTLKVLTARMVYENE
jgi:hypothetical protein